jgi:SAM-dependent methyltransferase
MIVTVGKSPIGGLILWAYANIPPMALFRSPQHLIILTILPLSVIIGLGAFALFRFIPKLALRSISQTRVRKPRVALMRVTSGLVAILFVGVGIWISPLFTGNLGADSLRDRGGGNFVDTFELSPDMAGALAQIYHERETEVFRTLFLPPASSPYYLKTPYQEEGQGGDMVITSTPGGISDVYDTYSEPIAVYVRDAFLAGGFRDPWMLEVANIRYIVLRNDLIPHFGRMAGDWNFTRTRSNLEAIRELNLTYEGPHVSVWKYETRHSVIYPVRSLWTLPPKYHGLLFSPSTEPISVKSKMLDDFENASSLSRWFASRNFEPELVLDSTRAVTGNRSIRLTYNATYHEGGGNLNYAFNGEGNLSAYRWVSVWVYYSETPPPNTDIELLMFNQSWKVLLRQQSRVEIRGWNNLIFELNPQNLSNAAFLRFQFYDRDFAATPAIVNIDSVELISFRLGISAPPPSVMIRFERLSATTYSIHISNASQPFFLIFSETYNPLWHLYEGEPNWLGFYTKPLTAEHLFVNGYANAWYVDPKAVVNTGGGSFTLTLQFETQSFFERGALISLAFLVACMIIRFRSNVGNLYRRVRRSATTGWPTPDAGTSKAQAVAHFDWGVVTEIFADSFRHGDLVLDIGHREGTKARATNTVGARVVGLDLSLPDLSLARSMGSEVIAGDGVMLPFQKNRFNGIICLHTMEHTTDGNGLLAECYRTLRPGGKLIVVTPNEKRITSFINRILRLKRSQSLYPLNPDHVQEYSRAHIQETFGRSSFSRFQVRPLFLGLMLSLRGHALDIGIRRPNGFLARYANQWLVVAEK